MTVQEREIFIMYARGREFLNTEIARVYIRRQMFINIINQQIRYVYDENESIAEGMSKSKIFDRTFFSTEPIGKSDS